MILWKYIPSVFTRGNNAFHLLTASMITFVLTECESTYRPIQSFHIRTMESGYTYCCDSMYVQWKYHVLSISGNDAFSFLEKQSLPVAKVSLLGFYLQNNGTDTLRFPEDFRFLNEDNQHVIEPLSMSQAYRRLKRPGKKHGDEWWHEIIELFDNQGERSSNKAFKQDLNKLYLSSIQILPGKEITGLLALPVASETSLEIVCKTDTITWRMQDK